MGFQADTEIKIIAEGVSTLHKEFDFQVSTSKELLKNQERQTNVFENTRDVLAKSLQSLGNKLGNVFNNSFKTLTAPFRNLSVTIGSAFSNLKSTLVAPFQGFSNKVSTMFGGIKEKFSALSPSNIKGKLANVVKKPREAIKTMLGRNDEQLKARYYRVWWNPKNIAKIFSKEFQKKQAKTPIKKETEKADVGSVFANVNKVLKNIASGVSLISKAVSFFFMGPGAGMAIAVGISPLVLLLGFVFYTLYKKMEPLIDSIQNTLIPLIETIGTKVNEFLQNPGQFIGNAIKSSVSGIVGGVVGGVTSIFSSNKDESSITDMDVVLKYMGGITRILRDTNTYIKNDLATAIHSKFKELIPSKPNEERTKTPMSDSTMFDKLNNSFLEYTTKMDSFHNNLYTYLGDIRTILDKPQQTFTDVNKEFATSLVTEFKNSIDMLFGIGERTVKENVDVGEAVNPFTEIISGFEKMNRESIKLLSDIRTSLLNIEKNKIKIGADNATNTGTTSDAKKTNNLQNIALNYNVDISEVLTKMDETNRALEGILTNTSLGDNNERKSGSVWSI